MTNKTDQNYQNKIEKLVNQKRIQSMNHVIIIGYRVCTSYFILMT